MVRKLDRKMQQMKPIHLLTLYTRINYSKGIKELNVKLKTIKILDENIGSKILNISCSNTFSNLSPQAEETKKKLTNRTKSTMKFLHHKGNHQQNEKTTH